MNRKWIGLVLILIGGITLLSNLGFYQGEFTLLIIGALLLFLYNRSGRSVFERRQGLLIAGAIVTMVGVFALIEQNLNFGGNDGYLFFILLGTAFLIVYIFHTRHLKSDPSGKRRWPLYPAAGLWGFGGFVFMVDRLDPAVTRFIMSNLFPIGLMAAGVVIIFKAFRRREKN